MVRLKVDFERCSGCKICELACSLKKQGGFGSAFSRIRIKESLANQIFDIPIFCKQCEEAYCVKACPVNAIGIHPITKAVFVKSELCIGCISCILACPEGAIFFDNQNEIPIICDLCGGDPECVKYCPTGAISVTHHI